MKSCLLFLGLSFSLFAKAQIAGTKTIKSSGGDYSTLTAAVQALNSKGVGSGGITFNVEAGFVSTETVPTIIVPVTAPGSSKNPILFQKSGVGDNPRIIHKNGQSSASDAIIRIQGGGSQYITFDGIDLQAASDSSTEYGFVLQSSNPTTQSQNIKIQNCNITLNRANPNTVIGVYINETGASNSGGNAINTTLKNLWIKNSQQGILVASSASSPITGLIISGCTIGDAATPDDISSAIAGSTTVGGGPINNLGVFGINAQNVQGATIFGNTIQNLTSSTTAVGAFPTSTGIIVSAFGIGNSIYNNFVGNIKNSAIANNSAVNGIRIESKSSALVDVYNNVVFGLTTLALSNFAYGININSSGTSTGGVNAYFNSVRLQLQDSATGIALNVGNGGTIVQNNILSNFSVASSRGGKKYCIRVGSGTLTSNNNILYFDAAQPKNFTGNAAGDKLTLANWQATSANYDVNSYAVNPGFTSPSNLKPLSGFYKPGASITGITTDILNQTRFTITAIGAYESDINNLPVTLVDIKATKLDNLVSLNWVTANEVNHKYFEVSCSVDGKVWTVLGKTNEFVSSSKDGLHVYVYKHDVAAIKSSILYYRLKQIDLNGEFTYSKIVSVSIKNSQELSIYPNPVINSTLHFTLNEAMSSAKSYKITNVLGKTVQVGSLGSAQRTIQFYNLSKGSYWIILDNGQRSHFVLNN